MLIFLFKVSVENGDISVNNSIML